MKAWRVLLLAIGLASARLPLPPLHPGLRCSSFPSIRSSLKQFPRNLLSELPGLQCLPNGRGCTSRRRARPGGVFPRGRGLPPIPRVLRGPKSPPRLTQRVLPPWQPPLPRVATLAPWHPGVSTQKPAESRQFQAASEALEAGKRSYWRGIAQDHFRNLSPNAKNHRYGREVALLGQPESRQAVRGNSVLDVSIKIPVTNLPTTKQKSFRVSKTVTTSTSSKSQSIGSTQSEYGSNFPTSVPEVIENSIDRTFITPTTVVKHKLVPLQNPSSTHSKPTQSPVKTYYDAIFTKPTSPPSKRPNTPPQVFFNRNRSRTKTVTPAQEVSIIYTTLKPKHNKELEEDPDISHFSPTPRPKRNGKGKKFFRHSLPAPLSIVDNYKDIEVKNKKLLAKSSDKIAEEIIAMFKS